MSGNTSGALGFVQGIMGGMEARQDYERNKRVDSLLDQELQQNLNADVGAYEQHLNEGGDPMNWVFQQEKEDPFLVKQIGKFKSWLTGTEPEARVDPYQTARDSFADRKAKDGEPQMSAIPNPPSGRLVNYADGGQVEPMEDEGNGAAIAGGTAGALYQAARSGRGRNMLRRASVTARRALPVGQRSLSGAASILGTKGRGLLNKAGRVAAPITLGITAGEQFSSDYDEKMDRRFGQLDNAGDPSLLGFGKWAGRRLLGFASDLGNNLTFGLAGNLYRDNQEPEKAIPTGASTKTSALPDPAQTAAVAEATGDTPDDAGVAANAQAAAVEATPGHPDNPDQQFNFQQMAADGWKPDDIAHVPLKDWKEYRRRHVTASIKRGMSVADANAEVDQIQHSGFIRNFQQASYLYLAGDTEGAALAARAAYQYFPNGSDIRFQSMQGKDGNTYLVGMGVSEETGELVGEPQVITPDYMNAMLANFEDPKAFNAWKADQDEAYRLEREYKEITKPQAQAELDLTVAQTDQARAAATNYRAQAAAEGQGSGLPTEANKLAAHDKFVEDVGLLQIQDPQLARKLVSVMERIYSQGGNEVGVIIDAVRELHAEGGDEALNELVNEWLGAE